MKRIAVFLFFFGWLLSLPLYAEEALTGKTVRQFIDSISNLEQLSKKYGDDQRFTSEENRSMA